MWIDSGKIIVAKGFKNLPKVQLIPQSGQTGNYSTLKLASGYSRLKKWFKLGLRKQNQGKAAPTPFLPVLIFKHSD